MNHEKLDALHAGENFPAARRAKKSRYQKGSTGSNKRKWLFLLADVLVLAAVFLLSKSEE